MRFFKIITYVFLIGFVIDLFGNLFKLDDIKDDYAFYGKKASLTLALYIALVSANIVFFDSNILTIVLWILLVPTIVAFFYYSNQNITKKESESLD